MNRALLPLKAGAIVFTLLWTAWMMWWSGSFSRVNVIILALCGTAVGYLWYRAMRWQLERMGMLRGKGRFIGDLLNRRSRAARTATLKR